MNESSTTTNTQPRPGPESLAGSDSEISKLSWPHIVGGSALFIAATRGGLLRGLALTGAGAATLYRGARGHWPLVDGDPGPATMSATVTINRPIEELYDLWRDLETFQTLVPRVDKVAARGRESSWEASMPGGAKLSWKAEITREDRPRRIEWRATGSPVPMTGSVSFSVPPGNRGTEVRVRVVTEPPGGSIGARIASAATKVPERQMRRDLVDLKRHLEAGEVATVEGQPHGARGPLSGRNGSAA